MTARDQLNAAIDSYTAAITPPPAPAPVDPKPWAVPITPDPSARWKAVQTALKITADGLVGNGTLTAIERALNVGAAPAADGKVLWDGTSLSGYDVLQPAGVTAYTAAAQPTWPAPPAGTAFRLNVGNGDTLNSTGNRCQLDGRYTLHEGDEVFWRLRLHIPATLPADIGSTGKWMVVAEMMAGNSSHGTPESGTFDIRSIDGVQHLCLSTGQNQNWAAKWSTPIGPLLGRWIGLVYHLKLSSDPSAGFGEVWLDGAKQRRSSWATCLPGDVAYPVLTNYRAFGSISGDFAVYSAGSKIGTSLAAATI